MRDTFWPQLLGGLKPRHLYFEDDWRDWTKTLFPAYFSAQPGDHHAQAWDWLWSIQRGVRPPAFFGVWPRGHGKSTTGESAVVASGALGIRTYWLYVCRTQDQADDHVGNIAGLLESPSIEEFYPALASRKVGKYGSSRGWRRNRLRTASGFTVDALGLDTAARGVKLDEMRPDGIILDDIDSDKDSLSIVEKNERTISKSLLPAGSGDCAVVFIQNLIHEHSVLNRAVTGVSDILASRVLSGPISSVDGLAYEAYENEDGTTAYRITAGTPTWPGQSLASCEALLNAIGPTAFKSECQQDILPRPGGIFSDLTYRHCPFGDVPWKDVVRSVVWVDPAVTNTDASDCQAIQCDALSSSGTIYRLHSFEARTSPEDAIRRAIEIALQYDADTVGIETDQGGDTWRSVWARVVSEHYSSLPTGKRLPRYTYAKAGAGMGSKSHRAQQMLVDYEQGKIVHVLGTHSLLEKGLYRFPAVKPFDLVDAAFWAWHDLRSISTPPPGALVNF